MLEPKSNILLVSDVLKDSIPEMTDDILSHAKYRFVTAKLEVQNKHQEIIVAGSLVGLCVEDVIRLDFKIKLEIGFDIMSGLLYGLDYKCSNLTLTYGDEQTVIEGEMKICAPKIYDIDHENMLCTLAIDLVRKSDN